MLIRNTYTEYEIIALIRQNNKKGFDYLYERYCIAICCVISRIITDRQEAEDILKDVFIYIWANINQYDPAKGHFYIWMHNIATNKCRRYQCRIKIKK